ncbi:MAG: lactate utilization protein [Lachnospiraceae bacterium]|nr:lactate utilization protein [Lachnospiraceae bacterium]MCM1230811.1 lactate utilization protein [Ruminococcus flavefaciens]
MDFSTVEKNLKSRGYEVTIFETASEAVTYLDMQIDNQTVGFGGSMTLEQMGLFEKLQNHNTVFWHQRISESKKSKEIRLTANKSTIYISSVNGLAETGEIVNINGNCNRVASIFYGHENVYFVIGKNKVEKDYESALYRARNIAAPMNAKRVGAKTPCAVKGDKCYDCKSKERICRGLSVLCGKPMTGKFEVILMVLMHFKLIGFKVTERAEQVKIFPDVFRIA